MFDLTKKGLNIAKMQAITIPADKITPIKILSEMDTKVLLESAYSETGKGKYSILILKEAFTIYKEKDKYYLKNPNGKKYSVGNVKGGFLQILKEFRDRAPENQNLYEFPIPLGGLGYLGYEYFTEIEDIQFRHNDEKRGFYDCAFIFGRNFLIFDHIHDTALVVSVSYSGEIEEVDLQKEIDEIQSEINRITSENHSYLPTENKKSKITDNPDDKEKFIEKVNFVKNEIYKGNMIQCVLSRRVEIETNYTPLEAYRNLRMRNPSPYMFYLNFNDFVIYGASPEVMVKVKNDKVILRPIAGTRKRGDTLAMDNALENELKNDVKEKAEHLMLVDLGRNDIGVVAAAGSVKVTADMVIERYSDVMHIVSEVEGALSKDKTTEDAIKSTFPAGTVSGAPKIQAIKTIDKLEDYRRNVYAGLIGYFERNGDFDSCIAIRTAISKGNKVWLQAGAGLVYDSIPEKEYEETENKMKALYVALGLMEAKNDIVNR
ncbi:MAG TPA: chorismate-binding protein [Spirochaetota bacterium]|nr:chorismate-binding protein [Spirochaetota bacterium]